MKTEAQLARNPRYEQQKQRIDDECNKTERQDIERKCDYSNGCPDDSVDQTEDQRDQQVRKDRFELAGRIRSHGDPGNDQRREPQSESIDDQFDDESHCTTMSFGLWTWK